MNDFVLLTLLCGNDFIPQTVSVAKLEALITSYQRRPVLLFESGMLRLDRLGKLLQKQDLVRVSHGQFSIALFIALSAILYCGSWQGHSHGHSLKLHTMLLVLSRCLWIMMRSITARDFKVPLKIVWCR